MMVSPLTLETARELARSRGGVCLSKSYRNTKTKMSWECSEGHSWEATLGNLRSQGQWCPSCAGNAPLTLQDAQKVAETKGGVCLSDSLTNSKSKLKWQCSEGHIWEATFSCVRHETWCPVCAGTQKHSLPFLRSLAEHYGGRLLSEDYVPGEKLLWVCSEGHQFELSAPSVIHDLSWCKVCSGYQKYTLDDFQELARLRGGSCLSSTYSSSTMLWSCVEGHVWYSSPHDIRQGKWCPVCARRVPRTIEEMRAVAGQRGGLCLSETMSTVEVKLKWCCEKGHSWWATPHSVLGSPRRPGTWCPRCLEHKSEKRCRREFEEAFGADFPKSRPSWLVNSRGNQMELDGYSEKLSVAFEYQGEQHYNRHYLSRPNPRRPALTEKEFAWLQQRDREKVPLCVKNGVTLFQVPWYTKDLAVFAQQCKEASS